MKTLWFYLMTGSILGLASGLSPGPLLALVVSETLRQGVRTGVRLALVPLATDGPIIVLTLLVLSRMAAVRPVLGIIALTGAAFLLMLGYENLSINAQTPNQETPKAGISTIRNAWRKGLAVNALNPNAYLFWFSVGAPTLLVAWQQGPSAAALFLLSFYALLTGSKIFIALLVGKSRAFIGGKVYAWALRILGLALWALAAYFLKQGLQDLGIG